MAPPGDHGHHRTDDDVIRQKLDRSPVITHGGPMRRIERVVEVRDRTTLIPGEEPMVAHPRLGFVIDALFALRENPDDRTAKMTLALLRREGACVCPGCGDDVGLAGFRRTRTDDAVRDEYRCGGCDQRYLLADEHVC
jgi:hypothetical protein